MTTQTRTDIVRLDEPAATERSVVGAKAAHLAELRAAGFPVPDGAVLPASLLAGWRSGEAPPPEVERCVTEIVASFSGAALAVRSSADAEDGASASFAGTYATVLGATGVEEVTKAGADVPRQRRRAEARRLSRRGRRAHVGPLPADARPGCRGGGVHRRSDLG